MSSMKVFGNSNVINKSSADIVQESMSIGQDDKGVLWLLFRGSEGKGTGAQKVKFDEVGDIVGAVKKVIESGINSKKKEEELTAAQMFERTFALRDAPEGKVGPHCTFRFGAGKYTKPITIPVDELASFLAAFQTCAPQALRQVKGIKGVSEADIEAAEAAADELSR